MDAYTGIYLDSHSTEADLNVEKPYEDADLIAKQIRKASGPLIRVNRDPEGKHRVSLTNRNMLKEFYFGPSQNRASEQAEISVLRSLRCSDVSTGTLGPLRKGGTYTNCHHLL